MAALLIVWGAGGVLYVLIRAVARLTPIALEPVLDDSMDTWQWLVYTAWVGINAYAEGYRGFHLAFSPRVAARTMALVYPQTHTPPGERPPGLVSVILAPVYCFGLIHATRRRLIVTWLLIGVLVGVITIIRWAPQPYRGMVDGGVVVGLSLGIVSLVYHVVRGILGYPIGIGPGLPEIEGQAEGASGASES